MPGLRGRRKPVAGGLVELGADGQPLVPPPVPTPPDKAAIRAAQAELRSPMVGAAAIEAASPAADAFDPAYEAHMLRVSGLPWDEVAGATGYATPGAAARAVSSYLSKAAANQSSQHLQEALQTQVDRYEKVLSSWWTLGTTGKDEKAAGVVLRALERLDRLLKLTDADTVVTRETLVISADRDEYIAQLKALTDGEKK